MGLGIRSRHCASHVETSFGQVRKKDNVTKTEAAEKTNSHDAKAIREGANSI